MNPKIFILSFLFLATALALIPFAAAQDGNAITDAFSGFTEWISSVPSQISTFATEQPVATGVIGTTGGIAGVAGIGWKAASSAKNKIQSAYNTVKEKLSGAESQTEELTNNLKTTVSGYEDKLKTVTTESEQKILGLQKELEAKAASATEFKNLQDQNAQLQELVNNNAQTLASNTKVLMDPVSKKYYQASVVKEITVP